MLDIEVTRRCNLRCDYCFVGWSRGWSEEMPEEIAREVIREGAGRFATLHITGGEPLAYRPLFSLVALGAELGYREILINTNGTLLSDQAVSRLAAHRGRLSLSVSLDGPEELHDRARGAGRFREAAAGIRRALAAGLGVTAMTVVTPEVLAVLGRFLRGLQRDFPGLAGVTLFPVGVGPEGSQKPGARLRPLDPGELTRLALLTALIDRTGIRVGIGAYPIANPLLIAFGYPRERLYQCEAGRGRVCVHADLGVSSCHPVKEPIYGRWRPGLLSELGASPVHGALARRQFAGCSDCEEREVCGHCRAFVAASGAGLLGNDFICHEVLRQTPRAPPEGGRGVGYKNERQGSPL
jgi:MoaA/NifB/PqqE/SkfB family radical SAM enzyme